MYPYVVWIRYAECLCFLLFQVFLLLLWVILRLRHSFLNLYSVFFMSQKKKIKPAYCTPCKRPRNRKRHFCQSDFGKYSTWWYGWYRTTNVNNEPRLRRVKTFSLRLSTCNRSLRCVGFVQLQLICNAGLENYFGTIVINGFKQKFNRFLYIVNWNSYKKKSLRNSLVFFKVRNVWSLSASTKAKNIKSTFHKTEKASQFQQRIFDKWFGLHLTFVS